METKLELIADKGPNSSERVEWVLNYKKVPFKWTMWPENPGDDYRKINIAYAYDENTVQAVMLNWSAQNHQQIQNKKCRDSNECVFSAAERYCAADRNGVVCLDQSGNDGSLVPRWRYVAGKGSAIHTMAFTMLMADR